MNELVNKSTPVAPAPITFSTSDDYKGHLVKADGYNSRIFCKKYYKIDDYFCLDGVKIKRNAVSDIRQIGSLELENSYHYENAMVYLSVQYNRKQTECFFDIDTKMIKKEHFDQANSYKGDIPEEEMWIGVTAEDAIVNANKEETKRNRKIKEENADRIPIIASQLYDSMIYRMLEVKSGIGKKFSSFAGLSKKYPMAPAYFNATVEGMVADLYEGKKASIKTDDLIKEYLGRS